ncbi:MAG: hypothetical protein AAFN77_15745 [Planctomycetota bacterium]
MNAFTNSPLIKLTRFEHGIIRRKVDVLIGRAGFTDTDRHSLRQELTIRLMQSLCRFDPKKAHRKTFSTTVVERSVAKILRFQRAEKRNCQRVQSLNVRVRDRDGYVELGEMIGAAEYDARRGRSTPCPNRQVELEHDLKSVIASLPAELRELAELLKDNSLTQIAKQMNVSKRRLRTLISELREVFEENKLRFYL